MKKRSKKLQKIVTLANSEERRHGAATGESRARLDDQVTRLGELNAYRQEYAASAPSTSGVSSVHWQDYQSFLQRLDQAVAAQQQIVRDSERNLEMHRRRWMAKRQRLESLQRVLDRYRDDERAEQQRQQQRSDDELPGPQNPYTRKS